MKSKFEKKETSETKATFSAQEVRAFMLSGYSQYRRQLYLNKVAEREPNPRLLNGMEVLSPQSMVAEIDMMPLSTRNQMARFVRSVEPVNGDGYDADTDHDEDETFHSGDRTDNIPTPFELRSKKLEKKLTRARKAHADALEQRQEGGDTPTPNGDPNPPKVTPEADKSAPIPKKDQ